MDSAPKRGSILQPCTGRRQVIARGGSASHLYWASPELPNESLLFACVARSRTSDLLVGSFSSSLPADSSRNGGKRLSEAAFADCGICACGKKYSDRFERVGIFNLLE